MLATARLALRHLTAGDAPFILELLSEPSFIANIGDKGVRTESDARRYIVEVPNASYERHGFGLYLVSLRETGEPIGMCGLVKRDCLADVDVGFAFLPRFWSRGYAWEAAQAVLAEARERWGLRRVAAVVAPGNAASKRLLGKLGFRLESAARLSADGPELELFAAELPIAVTAWP
jgi:RimJ/RimL family protein N-acetyltransferase